MTTDTPRVTGWVGWGWFAGTILLIAGAIDVIYGFFAVFNPRSAYFVVTEEAVAVLNVSAWGWWHVISGALLVLVGVALLTGATWARWVAVILVILNAIGQLFLIPVQPWWSLIVFAIDLLVIYALTVHGRELKAARA